MKSLFGSSAISLISAVISYFILILVSRLFEPEVVGKYFYLISISIFVMLVLDFVSEQCSTHFVREKNLQIESLIYTLILFRITLASALLISISVFSSSVFFAKFESLFLFLVPIMYLSPLFEYYRKNHIYALLLLGERVLFLCAISLSTYFAAIEHTTYMFFSFAVSTFICICFQILIIRKIAKGKKLQIYGLGVLKAYFYAYASVYLVGLMQATYGHFNRWVIESKFGLAEFANITIAISITNLLFIVQKQVDKYFRQEIFQAHYSQNSNAGNVRLYLLFFTAPLILVIFCTYIFGEFFIVAVFGEKWSGVFDYLKILIFTTIAISIIRLTDIFVIANGLGKILLKINVTMFILFLILSFFFVDLLNPYSFCAAVVGIQFLHAGIQAYQVYNRVKNS